MENGRLPLHLLVEMKEKVIKQCLAKKMKWEDGAELLGMHPKALSRLKKKYLEEDKEVLVGRKPGPKKRRAWDKFRYTHNYKR